MYTFLAPRSPRHPPLTPSTALPWSYTLNNGSIPFHPASILMTGVTDDDSDYEFLDGFDDDEFEPLSYELDRETSYHGSESDDETLEDDDDSISFLCVRCNNWKEAAEFKYNSKFIALATRNKRSINCIQCRLNPRRRYNAWRRRRRDEKARLTTIRRVTWPEFMHQLEVGVPQWIEYTLFEAEI